MIPATPAPEDAITASVLEEALRAGAREAEVLLKRGISTELHLHQGRFEAVSAASETGIGIRFFLPGGRMGYVCTADTDPIHVRRLLEDAVRGVEETDGREEYGLPDPSPEGTVLPSEQELAAFDPRSLSVRREDRIEMARRIEKATLEADPRVAWVDTLFVLDGRTRVWLRNSKGFNGTHRQSLTVVALAVVARDGERSLTSYHHTAAHSLRGIDPGAIGARAATRASAALGGHRLAPRVITAVFDPATAAALLRYVAPSFLADTRQKGRSLFPDAPGDLVASPVVTLVDDGRLAGGLSSAPFDGEGVPTRRNVLIEKGVLQGILYDTRSGRIEGKASTGNTVRRSFRDLPALGHTNFYLEPGTRPLADILRGLPGVFRVLNIMNVGGVNPVTGELSIGASGVWLERGREAHPVSGVTLSGNLREVLRQVVAVGDDLEFTQEEGAYGSPSLVVEGLTVAG